MRSSNGPVCSKYKRPGLRGKCELGGTRIQVNGSNIAQTFVFDPIELRFSYTPTQALAEGSHNFSVQLQDWFGAKALASSTFAIDVTAPKFISLAPADLTAFSSANITITGKLDDPSATIVLAGNNYPVTANGSFSIPAVLSIGDNVLTLFAIDRAANTNQATLHLRLNVPPAGAPDSSKITIASAAIGTAKIKGTAGSVTANATVSIKSLLTGQSVDVSADSAGAFAAQINANPGEKVSVAASNAGGAGPAVILTVPGSGEDPDEGTVPSDPAAIAPKIDPTVPTSMATATAFLYSGANAIQTGVVAGTIEYKRVAVIRGKVLDKAGNPLPAVKITILNHPEFGKTYSRADGMFDMAVNGGGNLTVNYSKSGVLSAQRQIDTPWQRYVAAPDVVLLGYDQKTNVVDLQDTSAAFQVARGSTTNDERGSRTATVLFPQGTSATMLLPNGSSQPLTTLTVRATEYTVGPNGRKAMPGTLPIASAYTYAVEMSVDEAIAAHATTVNFSQPLPFYVDNFLQFPVGSVVPLGYFDRSRAAWVASQSGVVLKIVSITDGLADLDVKGDGQVADADMLAAFGITPDEQAQLAALYPEGATLWRARMDHFTPYDLNWLWDFQPDPSDPPEQTEEEPKEDNCCELPGSIISLENRVLGEQLPVSGTPFSLNYRSDRMAGSTKDGAIQIRLGTDDVNGMFIKRIDLQVTVAGRVFTKSFPSETNLSYKFQWDGLDAYGRQVSGAQIADIKISYVYDAAYRTDVFLPVYAAWQAKLFGLAGPSVIDVLNTWQRTRDYLATFPNFNQEYSRTTSYQRVIEARTPNSNVGDARARGFGGFSLSPVHVYDPVARKLLRGDGTTMSTNSLHPVVKTFAQWDSYGYKVAIAPNGEAYVSFGSSINKIGADGSLIRIAGTGDWGGDQGENVPALTAHLEDVQNIAFDSKGNLYYSEYSPGCVRRIDASLVIATVAGQCSWGADGVRYQDLVGDGGPATDANLSGPTGLVVDSQGNLYISDSYHHVVRKVATDGNITVVAGNGEAGFTGDGNWAALGQLNYPGGLALNANGDLLIADTRNYRIRSVSANGVISTIAGNGSDQSAGDGAAATSAGLDWVSAIAIDPSGILYLADAEKIRKVDASGVISTVGGGGQQDIDVMAALGVRLEPRGLAFDTSGDAYVLEARRMRKITPALPSSALPDIDVPSSDGEVVYRFKGMRHMQTLNARTGAAIHSFGYNANGYLVNIEDGDGNVTTIRRDNDDRPLEIISPDGKTTTLQVNADGYLASINNAAGDTFNMGYNGAGGLLTRFQTPRGAASVITYSDVGELIKDTNALGGYTELSPVNRLDIYGSQYSVSATTAEGRKTVAGRNTYLGSTAKFNILPSGEATTESRGGDGSINVSTSDGTLTTQQIIGDARFGTMSPVVGSTTVKMPSGLTHTVVSDRRITFAAPNDPLSLLSMTDINTINGKVFTTSYDAISRTSTHSSPMGRVSAVTTDAQGRPLLRQTAGILPINYGYDARGRLTSILQGAGADTRSISYTYSGDGLLDTLTDPIGRTTRYRYDAAGRVTSAILPDSRQIGFSYDANGNLTSVIPPSRPAHAYSYNLLDVVDGYNPPALTNQAVSTQYEYNLDQQPTKVIRPDSNTIEYAYDAAGRLSRLSSFTSVADYRYLSSGQLKSVALSFGLNSGYGVASSEYTYDGSLLLQEKLTGNVSGTLTYAYDNFFRLSKQGVNGSDLNFAYDDDGLLAQAGALTLTRDATNGLLTATTLGIIGTEQQYNAFGELAGYTVKQGSSVLFRENYTRDKIGRIAEKQVTDPNGSHVYVYDYDPGNGRLVGVRKDGTAIGSYQYDANGNRTQSSSKVASYDDQDRLTAYDGATYSYTANGELKQANAAGITNYDYDVLGNLRQATLPDGTRIDYLIDGRNRRIGKQVNGVTVQGLLYQGQLNPVAELDGNNQIVSRFVYGSRSNVPDYLIKGGQTYRIATDQLGSVRLVINSQTGTIAQRIDYDEYGIVTLDTNPGFQPFGFAGGLYDRHTKLTRFGARDYDALTGRWTAKDPIRFDGGDSNLFAYVFADPINLFDPEGFAGRSGERNWAGKPSGSGDEFKHIKPHPSDPNKVIYTHPQTGKKIVKPKPPGFNRGYITLGMLGRILGVMGMLFDSEGLGGCDDDGNCQDTPPDSSKNGGCSTSAPLTYIPPTQTGSLPPVYHHDF
jgi:RHS repeat-associated protein